MTGRRADEARWRSRAPASRHARRRMCGRSRGGHGSDTWVARLSLATRCSACGTVFRVVQDQLRVSSGWVRCGRCGEVFNAIESLVDLDSDRAGGAAGSVHGPRVLDELARVSRSGDSGFRCAGGCGSCGGRSRRGVPASDRTASGDLGRQDGRHHGSRVRRSCRTEPAAPALGAGAADRSRSCRIRRAGTMASGRRAHGPCARIRAACRSCGEVAPTMGARGSVWGGAGGRGRAVVADPSHASRLGGGALAGLAASGRAAVPVVGLCGRGAAADREPGRREQRPGAIDSRRGLPPRRDAAQSCCPVGPRHRHWTWS